MREREREREKERERKREKEKMKMKKLILCCDEPSIKAAIALHYYI